MSLCLSTLQQPAAPTPSPVVSTEPSALLAAAVLSVYAANMSRRQLRRLKRKAVWSLTKAKVRSWFGSRDTAISTRTLLYIILGLVVVILAFVAPILAIIALLGAVIYLLATSR
ncbi:MAG: hypothetical protein EOO08_06735 [Chitinophagaceae bacterium]|nr:MAG: hypothetical protein EOO08_06735 [Chitinophagaceae bacterium]